MKSSLHTLLSHDHARLEALLNAALRPDGSIDDESYAAFRRGLLRHIGIEERILFAELRRRSAMSEIERQLHRDHAALAALLVPPPSATEIDLIRAILLQHDPLEEEAGGLYERVEQLAGDDLESMLEHIQAFPEIPTAPHSDTPILRQTIAQLLREAEDGRLLLAQTRRITV
jgi:hemerythrin superfamily protein